MVSAGPGSHRGLSGCMFRRQAAGGFEDPTRSKEFSGTRLPVASCSPGRRRAAKCGRLPPRTIYIRRPAMLKRLALISAVSALAMGAALAQSPAPPASTSTPMATSDMKTGNAQFIAAQKPDQWLASKFKGTDVMGTDNQKVGDVTDILFDKSGSKIDAYVV